MSEEPRPGRGRLRKAAPWLVTGAGIALAGGGLLLAMHRPPPASGLDHQVSWPGSHSQPMQGQAAGPPGRAARVRSPASALDNQVAWPGRPRSAPTGPAITLPGKGTTSIVAEGIGSDGALGVPADVHTVGWDVYSAPMDSAAGSTVMDGHVNYAGQGAGFFSGLASVRPGEVITTTSPARVTSRWRITSERLYPKDRALPAPLFSTAGPRRLVLVSCGGAFDWGTGHYLSNVIVIAAPA